MATDTAAVDQSNNPMGEVLVDAGQTFHCDLQSCFLEDLAPNTVLEGFVEFEYSTGSFPVGHSTPTVTANIYSDLYADELDHVATNLDRLHNSVANQANGQGPDTTNQP